MIMWADESSLAAMIFNTDANDSIICARPVLQSGFDFRGVAVGFGPDPDGCTFCEPLIAIQTDDDIVWRAPTAEDHRPKFAFHLANAGTMRGAISEGTEVDLIVAGFAESIRVWDDEDAFRAEPGNETADTHLMGAQFDPRNPTPSQYVLMGTVMSAEQQLNSATRTPFWSLVIDAPFVANNCWQVVARPEDVALGVEPGNLVQTNVWACAMAMGAA
jgi:hypothetical protein